MIKYKVDIGEQLKKAGYSSYRLRKEKLLAESTLQKFRKGNTSITVDNLDTVCGLLECQPGDLLEWVPGKPDQSAQ